MKLDTSWILDRLRERSTWLGLTGCLTSLGFAIAPDLSEAVTGMGVAAASLISMLTRDK